ncbi:MAG: hypothetical protein HRT69_13920 [Flavobacteriaceae bacterium]|nr:hypothetical protein [Flavobacteriaceae bacterium]
MEFLNFEKLDLENNFIEVLLDGMFPQGFYVESDFDYDEEELEPNVLGATNITFWDFKILNVESDLITFNDRETKKLKQIIEFKLIDSLSDYLNNN